MTLKGIFIFKFNYSNEIYISLNKNHHQFLQFNEVVNGIFILFLVIFGTYQIICELFLFRSTFESLVVSCYLKIFCAFFVIERAM